MLLYFLIGFLCLILSSLSQEINQNGTVVDDDSFYPNASPTLETFDWQLVKEISPNYKNILISPISLKLVLALLYEGSGGDTEREFQNVLQFDKQENVRQQYNKILTSLQASERKEYILNIGTRIFLDNQKQPQRKFSSIAYDSYQTEIEPTNFDNSVNASVSINSWIQKLTNGRVSQIVKPDDLTRSIMIITNAIYFKGTWRHQFPKNQTQIGKFYVKPKETINVPFMSTIEDFYIKENTDLDATFLRLPYKGGRYSLWIILPNSKGGLPGLIKKINTMHILDTIYSVYKRTVQVNIPKFKFSFQENYVEILKKFGLKQMFQNTASFPGIVRGNSNVLRLLQVSDIIQKTGIELDEEGSVVYAATAVNIGNKFGEPQFIFNATHPFMFFLYEETASTILFIGKVENPLETENRFSQEANKISSEAAVAQVSNLQPAQNLPFLQPQEVVPPPPQQQEINLSDGRFSYFDIALLKEFAKLNENMLISPLSIKTTLAMVLEGAKGVCADEIQQALRIGSIGEARYYLSNVLQLLKKTRYLESANTVFVSDKVRVFSDYVAKLEEYKGYISPIDFTNVPRAVQTINQWVSEHTRGSIPEIISAENIYKDFVVVIANALHFKGKWKTAFDAKSTRRDWFLTSGKGRQEIFMMQVNNYFNYQFLSDLHAEAVEIPYDEEYSMLIVMPAEGNNIENLATDMHKLSDILDNLNSTELNLSIPKFETEYSKNLIDVLKPLRVRTIFSPEANLTGIVANDNVRVNNIIHKTKIEVDEQGTKAAAATGVIVIPLIGSTARKVTINRPFIYFIYHRNTRTIIFEGIFRSPQNPVQRQAPQTVNLRSNFYNSYN